MAPAAAGPYTRDRGTQRMKTSTIAALLALAHCMLPHGASAQAQISAGVLMDPDPSVGSARLGPSLSAVVFNDALGIPLFVEAGVARTDFTSLGQDYHHNYVLMTLGAEWFPIRGRTRVGARLGLGAVGDFEVVETHPSQSGGDNWIETIVPGQLSPPDWEG